MKTKDNIRYIISAIMLVGILWVSNSVYADELQGVNTAEYTETYKIYSSLQEEEKSNYIEPAMYPMQFDSAYLKNNTNPQMRRARSSLPSSYNLSEIITIPVKDQGTTTQCWAFSMTSVLESNIQMRTGKISERFSERHMDYATSKTFSNGTNKIGFNREVGNGGNAFVGLAYATNGTGMVKNSDMPFEDSENKIELEAINKKAIEKVNDAKIFTTLYKYKDPQTSKTIVYDGADTEYTADQVTAVRNSIKEYIMKNGVLFAYTHANSTEYYNNEISKATAYYCDSKSVLPDHAVTIVGWDDNYAVTNFNANHRPNNPGAYIVLNSYGTDVMNKGYYYISYEDALIESLVVGISDSEGITYDNIYQHDFYGYTNQNYILGEHTVAYGANVFTRNTDKVEELEEVVVCVPIATEIEVYVNPSDDSLDTDRLVKASLEKTNITETYNTIKLTKPIELTGDKFAIIVKYTTPEKGVSIGLELNYKTVFDQSTMFDCITASEGESFISSDAKNWTDFNTLYKDTNICIKGISSIKTGSGNQYNDGSNNNINNTNNNVNATNNNINISTENKYTDNTVANKKIPNAGNIKLGIIILLAMITLIISIYKCKEYKIVK